MSKRTAGTAFILSSTLLQSRMLKRVEGQLGMHGISFTEYMILHRLHQTPGRTMRRIDLAEGIGITASGVTRLLAPMEKIGLVRKDSNPRDARESLVAVAPAGETVYRDASVSFHHTAEELLKPLTDRQLETLVELTGRLL